MAINSAYICSTEDIPPNINGHNWESIQYYWDHIHKALFQAGIGEVLDRQDAVFVPLGITPAITFGIEVNEAGMCISRKIVWPGQFCRSIFPVEDLPITIWQYQVIDSLIDQENTEKSLLQIFWAKITSLLH